MFDELIKMLESQAQETQNLKKGLEDAEQNLEKEYKEKKRQILKNTGVLEGRADTLNYVMDLCKKLDSKKQDKESDE